MATENEIKLIGVDTNKIKNFLTREGVALHESLQYRRVIFDTIPHDESAWIRLRSDGTITTLTYKKSHTDTIDGMQEIEVGTTDFDGTKNLLSAAGLRARNYQENNREVYHGFDCMITIDYWPLIPPYVEIESDTKEKVEACLKKFEGLYDSTTSSSTEAVYKKYGIDLRAINTLTFEG